MIFKGIGPPLQGPALRQRKTIPHRDGGNLKMGPQRRLVKVMPGEWRQEQAGPKIPSVRRQRGFE